jgi:putative heme-binding domain-containing protein
MAKWSNAQLVEALTFGNIWSRRMAQRILTERRDPLAVPPLQQLLAEGKTLEARLAALWTLLGSDRLNDISLDKLVAAPEPAIRLWIARATGERGDASIKAMARLMILAKDRDPSVRVGVATAVRQFVSGSLTVNSRPPDGATNANVLPILTTLMEQSGSGEDPLLPFMVWMALEPGVAKDPQPLFVWMRDHGTQYASISKQILPKLTRRVCDTQDPRLIDLAVNFIGTLEAKDSVLVALALDGLLEGQRGNAVVPTVPTAPFLNKLKAGGKSELVERAQRLGALWGDAVAIQETLKRVGDPNGSIDDRLQAIRAAKQTKTSAAREAMFQLLANEKNESLVTEAIRALGEIDGDDVADQIIKHWPNFTLPERFVAAEVLSSRGKWLGPFFKGLETKVISSSDIPVTVIRALFNREDAVVHDYTTRFIGRYREANIDKLKLIEVKKKVVTDGPVDLNAGHEIARKVCFVCHKLNGEGADVGPDLTGVGRSSLDALLANVIDPNQVIGKGYENVEVTTKDGRTLSGRLVEDTDTRVKLLSIGPKEDLIAKSDVASMRVSEMSVMPEGLEQMPDADFRNLIQFILNPTLVK